VYRSAIKAFSVLKTFRLEREVQMSSRPSWETLSLPLLLVGCFVSWPLWATSGRIGAGPLAQPPAAHNSTGFPEAAAHGEHQSSQAPGTSIQSGMRFLVEVKGKYGFIDNTGKVVIPPHYSGAERFFEGLAAVTVGRKRGYIDEAGTMVIPPKYSWTVRFSDWLA
jgi:hypothetical protein